MTRGTMTDRKDSDLPTPPDGGWGWVVVFASFMILFVTSGVTQSFWLFLAELIQYLQVDFLTGMRIFSILVGVTLFSGPITSAFVNKYGCRPVTIVGAVLAGVSLIVSTLTNSVYMLYLTAGVGIGLGFGLMYLPAIVTVTSYFEKYRSLATGIAVCGSGLGTFVSTPLTQWLITELGWKGAITVVGVIVMTCVIYGALFRPIETSPSKATFMEDFHKSKKDSSVTTVNMEILDEGRRDTPNKMFDFSLLKDPILIIFSVSNFCTSVGVFVSYRFMYGMADMQGLTAQQISYLLTTIVVANTVGRIVLGYLSDKSWVNRLWVYNWCLTVCGISIILSTFCTNVLTFCVYGSTFGFTFGAYVGLTPVILVDLLGLRKLANSFGLLLLLQGIASFLASPLAEWLNNTIGSYSLGMAVVGSTLIASALILLVVPTVQRQVRKSQM